DRERSRLHRVKGSHTGPEEVQAIAVNGFHAGQIGCHVHDGDGPLSGLRGVNADSVEDACGDAGAEVEVVERADVGVTWTEHAIPVVVDEGLARIADAIAR